MLCKILLQLKIIGRGGRTLTKIFRTNVQRDSSKTITVICLVFFGTYLNSFYRVIPDTSSKFTEYFDELLCISIDEIRIPVYTGRKLNVHKTFRRRPGHLLNFLCTFSLRPVSMGILIYLYSVTKFSSGVNPFMHVLKNGQTYFKNLAVFKRKIFKVCLTIFQHHA